MDDVLLMHVFQPVGDLLHDGCCFFFGQLSLLLDLLQTAVGEGFQDEVDVLFIVEVAVERSKMSVVEVGLDLYLPQNV